MPKIVYFVKISLEVVEESNIKHMGNVGSLGTCISIMEELGSQNATLHLQCFFIYL